MGGLIYEGCGGGGAFGGDRLLSLTMFHSNFLQKKSSVGAKMAARTTAEPFWRLPVCPQRLRVLHSGTETCLIERLCSSGYCRGVKSPRVTLCSDGRNARG